MTTRVSTILDSKGYEVLTMQPQATVAALVQLLAARRIGAAPVVDEAGHVAGIVSERDVVRALADGPAALDRRLDSVMTTDVRTCGLEDSLLDLMEIMTSGRFRHLPVVDAGGRLAGIISIGDVVKQRLEEAQFELDSLKSYIGS
jgi:CBS domain-containing protein